MMELWSKVSLYGISVFYIVAGISHFALPSAYQNIIPPVLPYPKTLNLLTGLVEVLLGSLMLLPACRSMAAWGIILLLIAVFPANVYQLMKNGAGMSVPVWLLWVRLPLQLLFIYWAFSFT